MKVEQCVGRETQNKNTIQIKMLYGYGGEIDRDPIRNETIPRKSI